MGRPSKDSRRLLPGSFSRASSAFAILILMPVSLYLNTHIFRLSNVFYVILVWRLVYWGELNNVFNS